jgi:Glycosyltransferase
VWQELGTLWGLFRLYRKLKPELVHHVTIKPVMYGGIAAHMARVPAVISAVTGLGYVFIARGFASSLLRASVKAMYRLALAHPRGRVIFQNPDDRAMFLKAGLVDEASAVMIRGSGVDMKRFAPTPQLEGTPLVVFASRMLWDKGVGEFVEAARCLKAEGVDARFVLVGNPDPGNPAAVSVAQIESWQKERTVEWWGCREDMPQVFSQTHVVCLPSAYGEGVPKVLIEAAASGRPIVATDAPGCREIVRHGENGLLVPIQNAHALALGLRQLIEAPELRRRMGAKGRRLAESEFAVERVIAQTLAVYRELLT